MQFSTFLKKPQPGQGFRNLEKIFFQKNEKKFFFTFFCKFANLARATKGLFFSHFLRKKNHNQARDSENKKIF